MLTQNIQRRPKAKVGEIVRALCDLLERGESRKYVVVCKDPKTFESTTKAEWGRRINLLRSKLHDMPSGIEELLLDNDIAIMESLTFASTPPPDIEADVVFARENEMELNPPKCDVLILTASLAPACINKISRNITKNGWMVMYG